MGLENEKPTIVLIACQFIYSTVTLVGRAALLQGMNSRVFVVYRQCIAFLLIAPLAYFQRRETKRRLEWKSFWLIFLLAFVGVTINQNIYFEGLYLASSSVASAIANLTPAITFVMAYIIGLEKIDLGSTKSLAKITGTIICVAGAVAMAFVKGPKLLNNMEFMPRNSVLEQEGQETWLLGCFLLFGSSCFWSFWLILQVPVSASYPDHLALTAWMCLFAALQTGTLTLILEHDMNAWKLNSSLQIFSCFLGGIASAVTFFAQAWCISRRGPLFSAMFNPLSTVLVTVLACVLLREELYMGSSVGALAVIIGLYIVLWGKEDENGEITKEDTSPMEKERDQTMPADNINIFSDNYCRNIDLEEPLLPENSDNSFGKSPV